MVIIVHICKKLVTNLIFYSSKGNPLQEQVPFTCNVNEVSFNPRLFFVWCPLYIKIIQYIFYIDWTISYLINVYFYKVSTSSLWGSY